MRPMFLAAAGVGAMVLLSHGPAAKAAEVKTIAAAVLTAVFRELGPQFERDTGHKLVTRFAATSVVKREIDAGETFDLTISSTSGIDDWIKEGKIVAATRTAVAYAGLGVGVQRRRTEARHWFGRGVQTCAAQCEIGCPWRGERKRRLLQRVAWTPRNCRGDEAQTQADGRRRHLQGRGER